MWERVFPCAFAVVENTRFYPWASTASREWAQISSEAPFADRNYAGFDRSCGWDSAAGYQVGTHNLFSGCCTRHRCRGVLPM